MTLTREEPASVISCVSRAREGARTVRDVISAEMWEAVNTTHLALSAGDLEGRMQMGPYSVFQYVKERSALFWGLTSRTMLRDEARAFLVAGGRIESADMVLRMLRVAMPAAGDAHGEGTDGVRDGQALALLQAVGGFQAFRRAVPAPPNAGPVARFLLYERAYPDSVAASVDAVHGALVDADEAPRSSEPVLRLSRLAADLEFRGRAAAEDGNLARGQLAGPERAGADRRRHRRALLRRRRRGNGDRARVNYDIHYLTSYRYETPVTDNLNALRVRPATTSSQRCDEFHVRLDPEARIHRHVDYFGTEVLEFGVARPHDHLTIDVRARVVTSEPSEAPEAPWEHLDGDDLRRGRGRVPACRRR